MARYTYYFGDGQSDGSSSMQCLLGARGALACEIAKLGLPIASGFCITKDGCELLKEHEGDTQPDPLKNEVKQTLAQVEGSAARQYGDTARPLLLSVRCDAADPSCCNMSGVENLGLTDDIVDAWMATESPHFVWDSYRRLISDYARHVRCLDMTQFDDELDRVKHRLDAKCQLGRQHEDSEIPSRDLQELVLMYKQFYQEQVGEEFPQDPEKQLWSAIKAMSGSHPASTKESSRGTSVIVQATVSGNYDFRSGAGIACWSNDEECDLDIGGTWAVNAQINDVYANKRKPRQITEEASKDWASQNNISEMTRSTEHLSLEEDLPSAYANLLHTQDILQCHFAGMQAQGVEFAVQEGKLLLIQMVSHNQAYAVIHPALPPATEEIDGCINEDAVLLPPADDGEQPSEEIMPQEHAFDNELQTKNEDEGSDELSWQPSDLNPFEELPMNEAQEPLVQIEAEIDSVETDDVQPVTRSSKRRITRIKLKRVEGEHFPPPVMPHWAGPAEPSEPASLVLPLWQTVFAGGSAIVAARAAAATCDQVRTISQGNVKAMSGRLPSLFARNLTSNLPAFPTGAICCTCYVNLLHQASADGNTNSVKPLERLGCAGLAMTTANVITHPLDVVRSHVAGHPSDSLAKKHDALCKLLREGPQGMFRGLPLKMTTAVPTATVELCAIDLVRHVSKSNGCEGQPGAGLLLASGAAAGALTQLLINPINNLCNNAPFQRLSSASYSSPWMACRSALAPQRVSSLFSGLGPACLRSIPAAGVNSLVRVGLVTYFINHQATSS